MRAVLVALATVGALAVCLAVIVAVGLTSLQWADGHPATTRAAGAGGTSAGTTDGRPVNPATAPPATPAPAAMPPKPSNPPAPPADRPPAGPAVEITLGAIQAKVSGAHLMLVGAPAPAPAPGAGPADPPAADGPPPAPPPDFGRRRPGFGLFFGSRQTEPYLTQWQDEDDAAEWTVPVPVAGRYAVAVIYSSPFRGMGRGRGFRGGGFGDDGPAAGTFVVTVGGQTAAGDAVLAGRMGMPLAADAGTVDLPAGEATLKVRLRPALDDDGRASLLAVRGVRLVRVE